MDSLEQLYRHSLGLLTDLYQLTMAYGFWKVGQTQREAVYHLFFRRHPFRGGFTVACGLEPAMSFLERLRFSEEDLVYLESLEGNDGRPLFERDFLDDLGRLEFRCDVDAVPEGTVVFPHEPLLRVKGPIIQAQIVETALLNLLNFQTLIATKAARVVGAAGEDPVLEFGLRRAQGIDGALAASRAAHVGGSSATSNVLAGKLFGIPVKGTHAHSWVMSFDDEVEAFRAYARAMPNNCVFLVDTYDSVTGVERAAEVGKWLRQQGHEMVGIRLDSGDLARLSIEARRILSEAGFPDAVIVASNDLDEHLVARLKERGATISVWGIGTRLVTAHDQPALGGVYKLAAVRDRPEEPWRYKMKLSEDPIKVSNPGVLQVRRFELDGRYAGDVIYDEERGFGESRRPVDPLDLTARAEIPAEATFEDLLVPVFRGGRVVYRSPGIEAARNRARDQLSRLDAAVRRLTDPASYPVGLEAELGRLKRSLLEEARP